MQINDLSNFKESNRQQRIILLEKQASVEERYLALTAQFDHSRKRLAELRDREKLLSQLGNG